MSRFAQRGAGCGACTRLGLKLALGPVLVRMMLADVPVPDHAVEKLASCCRFADADELADRLERALDDGVSLLALTIDGIEVQNAVTFPVSPFGLIVESKVTAPLFTGTEYVKNHGQYVKAMGGGEVAAQKCAGMPLNSTQGK